MKIKVESSLCNQFMTGIISQLHGIDEGMREGWYDMDSLENFVNHQTEMIREQIKIFSVLNFTPPEKEQKSTEPSYLSMHSSILAGRSNVSVVANNIVTFQSTLYAFLSRKVREVDHSEYTDYNSLYGWVENFVFAEQKTSSLCKSALDMFYQSFCQVVRDITNEIIEYRKKNAQTKLFTEPVSEESVSRKIGDKIGGNDEDIISKILNL